MTGSRDHDGDTDDGMRDGMGDGMDSRLRGILAVALLSIIVGGTADLVMDDPETWLSFHVVFEMLMIAGGASFAPSRWSLFGVATTARKSAPYLWTARITAAQNTRNCMFSCGVPPGSSRFPCVLFPSDQLRCLPEPLTPSSAKTSPDRTANETLRTASKAPYLRCRSTTSTARWRSADSGVGTTCLRWTM